MSCFNRVSGPKKLWEVCSHSTVSRWCLQVPKLCLASVPTRSETPTSRIRELRYACWERRLSGRKDVRRVLTVVLRIYQ